MSLTSAALIKMLKSLSQIDEWVVVETSIRRMSRMLGPAGSGEVVGRTLSALLFRDSENGRGAARLDLVGEDEPTASAALAAAADRAIGEMSAVVSRDAGVKVARGRLSAELATHRVASSHEFASEYQETRLSYDLTLAGGTRVRGAGRQLRRLRLVDALARAASADAARHAARPLEPGTYDLLLDPHAVATAGFGCFAPLVAQASGERIRLGLSRYRPGQKVFAQGGDDFTLVSDGTIPFGLLSAPFGPLGEPVRRFVLVENGVAVDPALDLREGALAGAPPNGGVRNLVLSPGAETAQALRTPGERPLLAVRELAWLDADPQSGDLAAEVALASLERSGAAPVAVTGGLFTGNAFELLGRARLSRESGEAAWYRGPQALRIDRVEVVR